MAEHDKLADTTKENRAAEKSWAAEKSQDTEESRATEEDQANPKLQLDQKWSRKEYCQQLECWAGTPRPGRLVYQTATRRRTSATRALGKTFKNHWAIGLRGMANQQPTHTIDLKPNGAASLRQPGSQRGKQSEDHMKVY